MTVRGGLEHQAIVAVGRVFGKAKGAPIYIDALMHLAYSSRTTVFSKAAITARKSVGVDPNVEWLKDLAKSFHEPTAADFGRLSRVVKKYKKIYEEQFDDIRNKYVAHADTNLTKPELWAMFQKTKIRDMERLLAFLNQLYNALWQMYYNGRRPTLRPARWSVRSLVSKKLDDLNESAVQESIVSETRKCLARLVEAAVPKPAKLSAL